MQHCWISNLQSLVCAAGGFITELCVTDYQAIADVLCIISYVRSTSLLIQTPQAFKHVDIEVDPSSL